MLKEKSRSATEVGNLILVELLACMVNGMIEMVRYHVLSVARPSPLVSSRTSLVMGSSFGTLRSGWGMDLSLAARIISQVPQS